MHIPTTFHRVWCIQMHAHSPFIHMDVQNCLDIHFISSTQWIGVFGCFVYYFWNAFIKAVDSSPEELFRDLFL